MFSGVLSNNSLNIYFVTGIVTVKEIIMKIKDNKGSIIIHVGLKYNIIDAITTPTDWIKSPIMWANAALIF